MTRDEALKKIKKCLALARSANEHEAGAALRQAQKLMEQFGLREQDVSLADVREVKVKACSTAANIWELRLVGLVARAFGCEVFASLSGHYTDAGNYVRTRHWFFVGIDAAATVAGYACEVLLRQCARARLAHIAKQPKNCKPLTKTARGDGFALGWVAGAAEKVEAFASPAGDKALLLAYIEREHGELEKGKARDTTAGRKVAGHLMAGFRAGQTAQLHHGVGGMPAQGLLS
ncbi:MAG: hypothetical protein ABT03_15555 [Comamonas sp. SCN 67-35]|uniref:DUF2786 domain-containing protein n=1 Tax=Comamonas sp. SCN 67-35 TaxID=1660096 RepID=UPI000869CB4B|nr:DUF2786 domain-containing protein [Comamonas sp. SCN 67-35]ODU36657.1 MAG: hypothetical protein ABT03_15555 [Comamonas sp. SCN 67-35]OJV69539.1 MAG: hypothetical protein BGO35_00070 [Burkholderiales bacterium 64-34]